MYSFSLPSAALGGEYKNNAQTLNYINQIHKQTFKALQTEEGHRERCR